MAGMSCTFEHMVLYKAQIFTHTVEEEIQHGSLPLNNHDSSLFQGSHPAFRHLQYIFC